MARTVAEIDIFITMLCAACDSDEVHSALSRLLAQPAAARQGLVRDWISDLLIRRAPQGFIDAVACLGDDAIAAKACEAIRACRRG